MELVFQRFVPSFKIRPGHVIGPVAEIIDVTELAMMAVLKFAVEV